MLGNGLSLVDSKVDRIDIMAFESLCSGLGSRHITSNNGNMEY